MIVKRHAVPPVALVAGLLIVLGFLAVAPAVAGPACGGSTASLKALEEDIFGSKLQGPTKVGEEINLKMRSPSAWPAKADKVTLVWSEEIYYPDASYIAPHFSRFNLPRGAFLIVRSPDRTRSWTFTGTGKGRLGITEGFWGIHIPGDVAILELWSRGPVASGAVEIDRFAYGYKSLALPPEPEPLEPEALCGPDDSEWAKCLQTREPTSYTKSRAVARLLINGTGACTGWLVGSAGHLLTNEHCIGTASDAANTDYEFMAEGATCTTNCASWLGCPGTVAATSATFLRTNATLDYTLVQLPTNPTGTYGYFQLRSTGAVVNERMYIPGHPAAWGKRIADLSTHSTDGSGKCEVYSLTQPPCSGGTGSDVGYYCDTQGGSSGSPVVGYGDHLVIALHHCGICPNRGVPIQSVISDLGASLPPNALGGGYSCTVDVVAGTNTCTGAVTQLTSVGSQRTLRANMAGFQRMDVFVDLCYPTGITFHAGDSPTNDGYGGDGGSTNHDAEAHFIGTHLAIYDDDFGNLSTLEQNVIPASGCFRVQWSFMENTLLFDNDGNPADAAKVALDSYEGFELAPYAETDSEDPSGADANFWYVGLNRTVGWDGRNGTGLNKACFVLSTTTNPDPTTLSSRCP